MALSPLRSKALHHGRSLSLPSGSNPAISQFDENLSRLRSSEGGCSLISSMNNRVNALKKLYDSIDDLLLLPHNQQIISEKCADQTLDDHIRLMDACSTVKDIISLTKQDIRELLSAVRRKDVHGIHGYLTSRKKSKKMIQKSLKNLRSYGNKDDLLASLEKDSGKMALLYMLKDAESVAISQLQSLLSYTMGTKFQERKSSWSLVSKLMQAKKASNQGEETYANEFNELESFLQLSQENNQRELVHHLKEMDSSIEMLEEQLEFLFRCLIKTRVSLLNILNH